MPASPKLYFRGLLGAPQLDRDDWMVTDMAVVATLLDVKGVSSTIFSLRPFTSYTCCSPDGTFKYGDSEGDRLVAPAPNIEHVITDSAIALKARFLRNVEHTAETMGPKDRLLIFMAAHGDEKGNIHLGELLLNKDELVNAFQAASAASVFLWSTACYSGQWLGVRDWQGCATASATLESDSLTASPSLLCCGGGNTLTTLATTEDQDVCFPPGPFRQTHPEKQPPHWYTQNTPIATSNGLSLFDLTSQADRIKQDLSYDYKARPVASRVLPLPELTHDMLNRFRLLPCASQPSLISTALEPANQKSSAEFRRQFDDVSFQWPPSINKDELIELASPILDCQPAPTRSHLVYLRQTMDCPHSPEEVEHLYDIFRHRQNCQIRVTKFLKHGSWNSSYIPTWNVFLSPAGSDKFVEEFIAANDESAMALGQMIKWRRWTGPTMIWTDIRTQLAIAWAEAGRPPFSFDELEAIGIRAEELAKEKILLSPSGQSSQPLKAIVDWPELRFALDDLGILPDRHLSAVCASKSLPIVSQESLT